MNQTKLRSVWYNLTTPDLPRKSYSEVVRICIQRVYKWCTKSIDRFKVKVSQTMVFLEKNILVNNIDISLIGKHETIK